MAIAIQCPGCHSRLGVADTAAGTKIKCPKCARMVSVPGGDDFEVVEDDFEVVEDDFEVVEEKPKPRLAATRSPRSGARDDDDDDRPRKKRKVVAEYDDDEDDDEDEDDRPRKRKGKKRTASSSKLPLLIGGGVLLVLLLAAGGYFLFGKKSWTKFDAPDGSFTAYFPTGVPVNKGLDALSEGGGGDPKQMEQAKAMMAMFQIKVDAWVRDEPDRQYVIVLVEFPASMASQFKPEDLTKPTPKGGRGGGMPGMPGMDGGEILNDETSSISGQTAKQILMKDKTGKMMFIRMFFASNRLVMVGVRTAGELKVDDKDALEYFKKFEWKAPATPLPAPDTKATTDGKTPSGGERKTSPHRGR